MIDERLTLTVDETADALGVSRALVYRLMKTQGLPYGYFGGKRLVSRRALERWVEEQTVGPCR